MRNHIIGIQGSLSSYHDLAARKYFGEDVSTVNCGSFKEVCDKLANNKVDYGIIAIENKVAGSILLNYQFIERYNLRIIGEVYLPIELNLYGTKGVVLSQVREIISHPMALGQSQIFLAGNEGIHITEYKDTATCAKLVSEDLSGKSAVIAGPAVASTYGLDLIQSNVSDVSENYTRFYIISKGEDYVSNPDKASITLQTKDEAGQLSEVLNVIKSYKINLTKIQSVPIPEKPSTYSFHLDLEFDIKEQLDQALTELKPITLCLKVLGVYKKQVPYHPKEEKAYSLNLN